MEPKRPQLSLDELRQVKWLLGGALALFAIGMVGYIDVDAWVFMLIAGAAILACMIWPSLPSKIPVLFHRFAFPIIVAVFLVDLWVTGQLLPAVVRLDLFLLLYRGVTYRKRRDDLQVLILALFLIVIAGVITVSFVFAGQLLVFTAAALVFLLTVTVVDATEASAPLYAPGTLPDWAAHVEWRRLSQRVRKTLDWRIALLGGVLFLGVVAVSAVLFISIPRFQIGDSLFLDRLVARKSKTGFNDTIHFGDVTQITEDDSIAMNVDVSDPMKAPALPYWRMVVLDDYRDGTFRMSPALRLQEFSRLRGDQGLTGTSRTPGDPVWTFYIEAGTSRFLPLLGRFATVRFRETQYYQTSEELGMIALRDEPASMMAYRADGMIASDRWPDPRFGANLRLHHSNVEVPLYEALRLSDSDKQVVNRIDRSLAPGRRLDAEAFGHAANAWLVSHHAYSLSPHIPGGPGDPLVRWLGSSEAGHCELFAGSFVLLARSAGFPARVITGFKGGTWNGYSKNFTVRNSNAHAWAEIFDAKSQSWLREDPLQDSASDAQAQTREVDLFSQADTSWFARLNSIRVFWYRSIVNFDQTSQVETARAVRDVATSSGVRIRTWINDRAAEVKGWFQSPWNAKRWKELGGGIGAVALLVWVIGLVARAIASASARRRGIDPIRAEASRWLVRLGDSKEPVVRQLQRIRFGRKERWPAPEATFKEARTVARRSQSRP